MKQLLYNGRELKFSTIGGTEPYEVAHALENYRTTAIVLEPGDATRYELVLVWQPRHDIELVVLNINSSEVAFIWHTGPVDIDDFEGFRNEWTRTLLAHYINLILERMK